MIPIVRDASSMTELSRSWSLERQMIGFVPTMGALHDGHLSLVRTAGERCDRVAVSIFVNPLQFGEHEDLDRYPRDLEGDAAKLATVGCDAVFTTSTAEMYPPGFSTFVVNDELARRFEGEVRPGHFRGVLTVVAKLFHIVLPDIAFFGQKDAQQAVLLRRMARDLNFPLEVSVLPTVREPDGLAMSSRNAYLSPNARASALALSRGLFAALARYESGERSGAALLEAAGHELTQTAGVEVDYIALVDPETLVDLESCQPSGLMLVAAQVEGTRLIDNIMLGSPTP